MGSETIKLPTIHFPHLKQEKSSSQTWEFLKNQVILALQEFGGFEATFDQIPQKLRSSVIEGIKQFFEVPFPIKLRYKPKNPYHGYNIGHHDFAPLYESFGIDDALSSGSMESFTDLIWSEGNADFCKSIQSFAAKLSKLDQIVRIMVLESLGLQKYIDEHIDSADYLVRLQKYDPPQSGETELALASHTDKNFLTIMYQDEVVGMEIMTKDEQWINAQSSSNSFIVIVGDSFHAWTNGRLHPPQHRVMMTGNIALYSLSLFSVPKEGYIIKTPKEMVDDEHPLQFRPFDYAKYLQFYNSSAGRRSLVPLKAYCGT
ncbi:probable 2-oxoglutarate-dependent dioxygenase AOP1 [Henckelia pumila]|uniref:probable 2-oxoglutarate-dependent dioxygenase AOP1 n=1 Tax=Henckelia pumila TaxID=405737 RepID=UPI003C6DCF7A